MKSLQIVQRDFNGTAIGQRNTDGFFNATSLLNAANLVLDKQKVLSEFWKLDSTREFMEELSRDLNVGFSIDLKDRVVSGLYETKRGRGGCTWMHPYLFVKFAMWLSPKFEVQIIKWVYDNLIDFRNQAGDYYKELCSAIMNRYMEYFEGKPSPLIFSNEAKFLNSLVCGEFKGLERNVLNEKELDLLNSLQKLDIQLINMKYGKLDRHNRLRDYSNMYKMANF